MLHPLKTEEGNQGHHLNLELPFGPDAETSHTYSARVAQDFLPLP